MLKVIVCLLDSNRGNFQPRILRLVLSGLLVASHTSACDPKRTYFSSSAAGSQSVDRASADLRSGRTAAVPTFTLFLF